MCTYIFFRTSLYSADVVKIRTGNRKTARGRTSLCAPKVIQELILIFQNIFGAVMHNRDCGYAPILRFFSAVSDGATVDCQILNRRFSSTS